ncbi:MAG: dependent protein [Clostridiales bacterium]|jgi:hypothetical protein|nr:dependent protein [Clostridiales bacterium]MDK2932428.1 dependent protein [Clostridiales bacterium]
MINLKDNIHHVNARITQAAKRANRDPEEIMLIAVTKTVDADIINDAIDLGIKNIGENKVQEICHKYDLINNKQDIKWHLIGHLQTNKVKYIIDKVDLIHSVDTLKLAIEINKRAQKIDKIMEILVQVNVAKEESKFGVSIEQCNNLIEQISKLSNVKIKGLMTIAPYTKNPEDVRPYFRQLKDLSIDIKRKNYDNVDMEYLSMGMTGDFEVAIEEGANIVRIGTAIFGERQYN